MAVYEPAKDGNMYEQGNKQEDVPVKAHKKPWSLRQISYQPLDYEKENMTKNIYLTYFLGGRRDLIS
jgi:hypothetical protein